MEAEPAGNGEVFDSSVLDLLPDDALTIGERITNADIRADMEALQRLARRPAGYLQRLATLAVEHYAGVDALVPAPVLTGRDLPPSVTETMVQQTGSPWRRPKAGMFASLLFALVGNADDVIDHDTPFATSAAQLPDKMRHLRETARRRPLTHGDVAHCVVMDGVSVMRTLCGDLCDDDSDDDSNDDI